MSRVGYNPIPVPEGVEVRIDGGRVEVKGEKGQLEWTLPGEISIKEEDGSLLLDRTSETRETKALHGLARSLVGNMVQGVSEGFKVELEIVGVGYRAQPQGPGSIELQLGFSHPVKFDAPEGVTFDIPEPTKITVQGIDKQLVGQVAADIRKLRKPEPYKGKGIRYADERIKRKAGKAAIAAGP